MKRGTIKAFREHLNRQHAGSANHRNGRFEQKTRGYGDYLYHQDREKFDVELAEWLNQYQVQFIDVGASRKNWTQGFQQPPTEALIVRAVKDAKAVASRDVEAMFDCANAGMIRVGGFRCVGSFRVRSAERSAS